MAKVDSRLMPALKLRNKWYGTQPNLQSGDLVLIRDKSTTRGLWPKAIVDKCFSDDDRLVRRVRVRTPDVVLIRDVRKICILEDSS